MRAPRRRGPEPLWHPLPAGPPVSTWRLPAVTERAMWLVFDPALSAPLWYTAETTAFQVARRVGGTVVRLPLVADYRENSAPGPEYRSKVVWAGEAGTRDGIPPSGPVVIEHQDTEDNGSVTIWVRRPD